MYNTYIKANGGNINMKKFLSFIFNMLVCVFMGIFYSIKYLFRGHSWIVRIVDLAVYTVFVWSLFCSRAIMVGMLLLFFGVATVFVIWMMKEKTNERSDDINAEKPRRGTNIFWGMSETEAKTMYRRLLKQYHPDNINGDINMTQKIIEDYKNYSLCRK